MGTVPDLKTLLGPDCGELLWEFAEILSKRLQARIRYTRNLSEAVIQQAHEEHFVHHIDAGHTCREAVEQTDFALFSWIAVVIDGQDAVIAAEEERFRDAACMLLFWWSVSKWNPENQPGYTAEVEEPRPIGDSIEEALNGILPEHIAQARVRFLVEHADEVLQLRDAHKRVWEEMLGHEVRVMVLDGLSPRLAEAAAKNNLAVRKKDLDAELEEGLQRLSGDLQRKMQRLMEEMQTEEE